MSQTVAQTTNVSLQQQVIEKHQLLLGQTLFICIQAGCDRIHHVWCSCTH